MSFTAFLYFLGLTSLSSILVLHFLSFNIIDPNVPANNNNYNNNFSKVAVSRPANNSSNNSNFAGVAVSELSNNFSDVAVSRPANNSNNNSNFSGAALRELSNNFSDVAVSTFSKRLPNIVGHGGAIFHHFWLDMTWPFGYCSRKACNRTDFPPEFGIHGLWPVDKNGVTLNGTRSKIDIGKELRKHPALKKRMQKDWPNFENYKNDKSYYWFWRHEWSNHGTACPQRIFNSNPINYFNTTMNIYGKLKLMDALKRNNIKPVSDPKITYPKNNFAAAIKSSISNNDIILRCNGPGYRLLESVTLCVASNATTFIPCNRSREIGRNNCNNSIQFLSNVI